MKFKTLLHHLKKTEKILLVFLVIALVFCGYRLTVAFYIDNTEPEFKAGGVYTEGAVGEIENLNPLFVKQGTVSHDLTELIFSGLTKFDTKTGKIVPDLAEFTKSEDGKSYDFVLKDGVKWHDGKLLTADDIIFTYETVIKNPEFKGEIINYNDYSGVKVTKVDERTVRFELEKPDAFFLAKTMVGILPKHLLQNEPIPSLGMSMFNFNPIGTGPYRFVSTGPFPTYTEYNLEAFPQYYGKKPLIQNFNLRIFLSYEALEAEIKDLDGIRTIPREFVKNLKAHEKFHLSTFQLPQYVAIFINNEADKLKDVNVRLGLQLGTDKKTLIGAIGESKEVDTPLLEIDQENWFNQYSVKKANGALFETEWQVPNKDQLEAAGQDLEKVQKEPSPTAEVTYITNPNAGKDWKTSLEPITISGTAPAGTQSITIGDYRLEQFKPGETEWDYVAAKKFQSLVNGKNVYEVFAEDSRGQKTLIDAITIEYEDEGDTRDSENKARIEKENAEAEDLPTRQNKNGEPLILNLITSQSPASYAKIADILKIQWKKIGVELKVEVLPSEVFEQRVAEREYDLLLFGQNLGYNLDAYPYWHSSQANAEGLNLSQFKDFVVDTLLQQARLDNDEERQKTLEETQEVIAQEVPAIFLYSPTYYTAFSEAVRHTPFAHMATTSDRLTNLPEWYAADKRRFKPEVNFFTPFTWAAQQF